MTHYRILGPNGQGSQSCALSKASLRSVVLFASTFRLYSEDALRTAIDTFRQRVRP